jgi:hypothetical protein
MKRIAWFLLASLTFVFLSGCIVVSRPAIGPPPLRTEVVIARPGPGYVWIAGYWGWQGGRYVWVAGSWVKARPGFIWVPGRWEKRGLHWAWVKGVWRRG